MILTCGVISIKFIEYYNCPLMSSLVIMYTVALLKMIPLLYKVMVVLYYCVKSYSDSRITQHLFFLRTSIFCLSY